MKRSSYFFLSSFFLLFSCSFLQKNTSTKSQEKEHYVANCRIFDSEGKLIRKFFSGSGLCLFQDNGSLLYSNYKDSLIFYDKDLSVIWEKKIQAHHQINQTENGDFLILGSKNVFKDKKKTRYDFLQRISQSGEVVGEFDFYQNIDMIKNKAFSDIDSFEKSNLYFQVAAVRYTKTPKSRYLTPLERDLYFEAIMEESHVNSIYEIPENSNPNLKQGNIIVNVAFLGMILILDKHLKEIQKIFPAPSGFVHDVHVQKDGTIFVYNNITNFFSNYFLKEKPYSSIQVFSYPNMNLLFSHGGIDLFHFQSDILGGGEFIDKNTLIYSDVTNNIAKIKRYTLNDNQLRVIEIDLLKNLGNFQQIKSERLDSFLRNNIIND